MNFHAFMTNVAKGGYSRNEGRVKVGDPWSPTMDELTGLARWPRDDGVALEPEDSNKAGRFSYVGVSPGKLLGKLNEAGSKPGTYFNLDNILAIVANRAKDVYASNPEIGQRYYNEMRKCVKEAQIARKIDGGDHTKDTSWKLLEQWLGAQPDKYKVEKKNIEKSLLKQQTVTVLPAESTIFAGSQYKDMDWVATRTAITKKVGKKAVGGVFYKGNLFKFFKKMAADMDNARAITLDLIAKSALKPAAKTRATKAVEGIDAAHRRTIDQHNRLDQSMAAQGAKADGSATGCGFPDVAPSTRNKLRRTLKAKRRMARAKKGGVRGQDRKSRRA